MKKAREIFSLYIARTAVRCIGLKVTVIQRIQVELSPPYEELFDDAEIFSLEHLLQAWQGMHMKDQQLLREVRIHSCRVQIPNIHSFISAVELPTIVVLGCYPILNEYSHCLLLYIICDHIGVANLNSPIIGHYHNKSFFIHCPNNVLIIFSDLGSN